MLARIRLLPFTNDNTIVALACALVVGGSAPAHAQSVPSGGDGFLFRPPLGAVSVRGGFDLPSAGSDLFTFVTGELTVDKRDFSSGSFTFDVSRKLSPSVDAVFGLAVSGSTVRSEFRHWQDNSGRPIEQTTQFQRVPLTASIRKYLVAPGRSVGRFAWIPTRYAPYVGAGGGVTWYRFRQSGDFIDFKTLKVFPDFFDSDGWAPTALAYAGTDVSLGSRFGVTVEGRYQWSRGALGIDFSGFDRIDLSGFAVTSGILIRY